MLVKLLPKPLRRLARRYIEQRGFMLVADAPQNLHTMMDRRKDIVVETVVDVGASNGRWSEAMMLHFPNAKYLLVEAQAAVHGRALKEFKAGHPRVQCELCAAGDYDGETHFDATSPLGGVAGRTPFAKNDIVVAMKTLDSMVQRHDLRGPYLLKLDTHGFEVPILEGAHAVLSEASMLIIEAYNFTLCPGALRFCELTTYLKERGFRCVDMFDLMWRPTDNALWQMDMVFLPSVHPCFQINEYDFHERE
jgi:FkbM family methyltransferase